MTFTLTTPPGFADIPDTVLQAEKPALGLHLARISGNASFGAVRPEIFYGLYKDGETVNLPTSAVDGYTYSRNELLYVWGIYSTVNADSGWISGPGPMWYCAWKVGQTDGKVSCIEWYRNSEGDLNSNSGTSSDGVLAVYTIAQRGKSTLIVNEIPNFADVDDANFAVDNALQTSPLTQMSRNAKYSALAGEVIYLGEYYNGQTVTLPVSPADGYVYSIGECQFMTSWRWTTVGTAFTQPNGTLGQLHEISCSVNPATGDVTTAVVYYNSGYNTTTHGRVAVFAFCNRTAATVTQVNVPCKTRPWDVSSTLNTSFPFGRGDGTSPVRVPLTITAGDSVTLTYISGTVRISDARPYVDGDGQVADPSGTTLSGGKRFPTFYVTGSTLGKGGCSGAWVDAAGAVIDVIDVGNGGTFTAPTGTVYLQLGVNDVQFNDNVGAGFIFAATVNGTPPSVTFSSPAFTEIADEVFFAGNPCPSSLADTINNNLRLALVRQEYFGPTSYNDGDTIPLPTSGIDGYTYSRDELIYISDWASTGAGAGGSVDIRFWEFDQRVDSSGLVHCHQSRVPTGGGNLSRNEGDLRVLVVGVRNTPQTEVYDPTYDPRPPDPDTTPSQVFLVDGNGPGALGPTTVAGLTAHNVAAPKAYNKANYPANFSGTTYTDQDGTTASVDSTKVDDSYNPITPANVSTQDVHKMLATHLSLPHYAHLVPFTGNASFGENCNTVEWVNNAINQMINCGYNGVVIDWYGEGTFSDKVALKIQANLAARVSNTFKFIIQADHGIANLTQSVLIAQVTYLQSQYFGDANYGTISSKPVLQFFDVDAALGNTAMAAAKAATTGSTAFWMPKGSTNAAQSWVDGVMDWTHDWHHGEWTGADPYNHAGLLSFVTAAISSGKKYWIALCPGFDGTLTRSLSWSLGKYLPRDSGACWLSIASYLDGIIDSNCAGVQTATFNDLKEGSNVEFGIENDIAVSASISTTNLNWSVSGGTGDETTIAHYDIYESHDGQNVTFLDSVNTGVGTYDLTTAGLTAGTAYTLYVKAIGKPNVRNHTSDGVAYTA